MAALGVQGAPGKLQAPSALPLSPGKSAPGTVMAQVLGAARSIVLGPLQPFTNTKDPSYMSSIF